MEILDSITALKAFVADARRRGARVGLVPTMGALHAGHLSLVRAATERCEVVVASVFVNPLQFAPTEDLAAYPRDLNGDAAKLRAEGCTGLFTTTPDQMYPPGYATFVAQTGLTTVWEGVSRPTHFRGVLTVVLKLFHLVRPDAAFFGHKDFQQTVVIGRMVEDLNLDVEVCVCPTVRTPEGLALSSRNVYLTPEGLSSALALPRALRAACAAFAAGERRGDAVEATLRAALAQEPGLELDYAAVVDPRTLRAADPLSEETVAIVAARVGRTRLIDNARLDRPPPVSPKRDVADRC